MKKILRRKFLFQALLIAACFSPGRDLYAEEVSPLLNFPPLLPEEEGAIIPRLLDGKTVHLPDARQLYPADDLALTVWTGNKPHMRVKVENLTLKFAPPEGAAGEPFKLDINFDRELIIKHSNAQYPENAGGFKLSYDKASSARRFYYRARNGQSLAFFLPAIPPAENARALFICPREFKSEGSRDEKASLQDTGWRLSGARAEVAGDLRGYLKNAVNFVLAEARLFTTRGVFPPINFVDSTYAQNAQVSLHYKPDELITPPEVLDPADTTLGIRTELSLHYSTGYKRISRQEAAAKIKAIDSPAGLKVPLAARDIAGSELHKELHLRGISLQKQQLMDVKVNPGTCYLVLYQVTPIIHEYLKEDFTVPKSIETANTE